MQWSGTSGAGDRLVSRRVHDWRDERGNSVDDGDGDAGGDANRRLRSAVLLTLFASDAASVRGGLRHRRRVVHSVHLIRTVVAHTALATSVRTQLPPGTRRPGHQEAEQHDGRREAAARHPPKGTTSPPERQSCR